VSADKLILLFRRVNAKFEESLNKMGSHEVDLYILSTLRNTEFNLPVHLYCGGFWNGINKIEFIDVATLGLRRVEQIIELICANPSSVKISRIDWAVDVLGVPAWEVAACCHVDRVVNSSFYRSRTGVTFYPHKSMRRTILIYERGKHLLSQHHPLGQVFGNHDLTRIEVPFRGKGVLIREFVRDRND